MESNEADEIEGEGAEDEEMMEGEVDIKVQGTALLLPHPSPQVVELQRVEYVTKTLQKTPSSLTLNF